MKKKKKREQKRSFFKYVGNYDERKILTGW